MNKSELIEDISLNEILFFVMWVHMVLYRDNPKELPACYKQTIRNAVAKVGQEEFKIKISQSVKKISDVLIDKLNEENEQHATSP